MQIKCNCEHPCSNCIEHNIECEPVVKDLRKKKFSNSYVHTLRQQVMRLQNFIVQLKIKDSHTREQMLAAFDIGAGSNLGDGSINDHETESSLTGASSNVELVIEKFETGQISVYGKPVIYMPPQDKTKKKSKPSSFEFQYFHCPVILSYISNFFKWQYMEYNLYIYRESFLTDFFRDKGDLKESLPYCNEELIFAICACGSAIDLGDNVFMYKGVLYDSSDKFYNRSRYLLFQKLNSDDCNSITAVQTFLCLAFYDLGRGRTLSAWILSGIAFRIGLHMGFELNLQPSHEPQSSKSNLTDYDLNVRSRIYWGCRVADYFISFVLGRSPTLEYLNTTIPKSENLPTLPGIEFFLYYDPIEKDSKISNISHPLEQIYRLYRLAHKCNEKIHYESSTAGRFHFQTLHHLHNFNLEVQEWRNNLIDQLYWTKAELKTAGFNPNPMSFRYQYYTILLSINRDFIDSKHSDDTADVVTPRSICLSAIEDVYYSIMSFKTYHSLRYASLNMVYLCILSITILEKLPDAINMPLQRTSMIEFFGRVLKECSASWGLARSAYESFSSLFKGGNALGHHMPGSGRINASDMPFSGTKPVHDRDMQDLDESLIPSLNYS